MTESEAKGFIQGKLDCMNKCDIFNKEDNHPHILRKFTKDNKTIKYFGKERCDC